MLTSVDIVKTFADSIAMVCAAGLGVVLFTRHRLRADDHVLRSAIVVAALLGLRILDRFFDAQIVNIVLELVVASLPVVALLLAESLIRRHAPVWMKFACLGAGLAIVLLAALRLDLLGAVRIPAMGIALVLSLALVLGLMVFRDRASLMANENERITSLLIGFVILIPFAATDFLDNRYEQLVGMGAIGVLSLTLAFVRGVSGRPELSGYLVDLVLALAASLVLLGLATALFDPSGRQLLELGICLMAFGLGLVCFGHLRRLAQDRGTLRLHSGLAHARMGSIHGFLEDLRRHGLLKSSHLLEGDELTENAAPELIELLASTPLVSRSILEEMHADGSITPDRGAALSLLTAYQYTHAVSFGTSPPRILLCESTALGSDQSEEDEFRLLSRMAALIQTTNDSD